MYISKAVLTWEEVIETSENLKDEYKHAYSYLEHAEKLIQFGEKGFLIDAIANLKRAVDHRIKQISTTYKIKKIPMFKKNKGIFLTLEDLGIIKPIMLKNLLDLRNSLEHQFGKPPSKERCGEYSEFVWYFLKSTDGITEHLSGGPYLSESYDSHYTIGYDGYPSNNWRNQISGCLPKELISEEKKNSHFQVRELNIQTGSEYKRKKKLHQDLARKYIDDDLRLFPNLPTSKIIETQ